MAEQKVLSSTDLLTLLAVCTAVVGGFALVVRLFALKETPPGVGALEPSGFPLGVNIPKVHYQNSECLVSVRSPGEWHDIREFVQPDSPEVINTVSRAIYE